MNEQQLVFAPLLNPSHVRPIPWKLPCLFQPFLSLQCPLTFGESSISTSSSLILEIRSHPSFIFFSSSFSCSWGFSSYQVREGRLSHGKTKEIRSKAMNDKAEIEKSGKGLRGEKIRWEERAHPKDLSEKPPFFQTNNVLSPSIVIPHGLSTRTAGHISFFFQTRDS